MQSHTWTHNAHDYDFIGVHTAYRDFYIVIIALFNTIQLIGDGACKNQPCESKIPLNCIFTNTISSEYIILLLSIAEESHCSSEKDFDVLYM